MIIQLLGLPGSGKKTLMKQISKEYKSDLYYDFAQVNFQSKADIKVYTMFSEIDKSQIISPETKIMFVFMPKIFCKKLTKEYTDYFKIDLNMLYDNNPFLYSDKVIEQFNYYIFSYDYNFDNFKKKLNKFLSEPIIVSNDIVSNVLKYNMNNFSINSFFNPTPTK